LLSQIGVSKGDSDILNVYKKLFGIPKVAVMHEMIGTAAKLLAAMAAK